MARLAAFSLLAAALLGFTTAAHADARVAPRPVPPLTLEAIDMWRGPNEAPLPKPRVCREGAMAAPAVGVALGVIGIGLGAALTTLGASNLFGEEDEVTGEPMREGGHVAAIAVGSAFMAVGSGGVIYSSVRIRKKRQARRTECVK